MIYPLIMLMALSCWAAVMAQTIKAPLLYEQCQPLAEKQANTAVLQKARAVLKSSATQKRIEAAAALGKTCDPRAAMPLLEMLRAEDAAVRVAASEALGKLGHTETVDPLIEALQDPDWRVRAALGLTLASFNVHRARNAVLNLLINTGGEPVTDEGDLRARCLGVLVVNQMRDVRFSRKAVIFLFDFLTLSDPKLRELAEATALELQHTRNGLHEMIGILQQHNYPVFRRQAAYWLGQWGLPAARQALAEAALNDKDPGVQRVAQEALAKLK